MHFAREGHPWILGLGAASLILGLLDLQVMSGATLGITLFVAYFFRDPHRNIPDDDGLVLSPADGRVVTVESNARSPSAPAPPCVRVGIFLSPLDVHVNRMPVAGRVTDIAYRAGKFRAAFAADAADVNERNAVSLEDARGRRFVLVQIAGMLARRIVCRVRRGEQVRQGDRYGMILLGSRVDLYCPAEAELQIDVGQRVKAGETVIAAYRAEPQA